MSSRPGLCHCCLFSHFTTAQGACELSRLGRWCSCFYCEGRVLLALRYWSCCAVVLCMYSHYSISSFPFPVSLCLCLCLSPFDSVYLHLCLSISFSLTHTQTQTYTTKHKQFENKHRNTWDKQRNKHTDSRTIMYVVISSPDAFPVSEAVRSTINYGKV